MGWGEGRGSANIYRGGNISLLGGGEGLGAVPNNNFRGGQHILCPAPHPFSIIHPHFPSMSMRAFDLHPAYASGACHI